MHDTKRGINMIDFIKTLISETKELEDSEMGYLFILSIICLLADWFYIRFHVHHGVWLEVFRCIYILVGYFSHLYLSNRFFRDKRLKKEETKKLEKIQEALNKLSANEYLLMHKFAENSCICIEVNTDEEIEAALCLQSIFDFIRISNNKVLIKVEYLHLLEKIYFPARFQAKK